MDAITLPNGRKIGPHQPCFIVAEIGQNHNGDAYTATRLLKAAHDAGVDAVKFTKRHLPSDMTAAMASRPYDGPQSFGATYGEHRAALELSIDDYRHLKERMRYNEWPETMFWTVCDKRSADEIEEAFNPPLYKIASRDLDNIPLIEHVSIFGKPIILSTGMSRRYDIHAALAACGECPAVAMVCTSVYPCEESQVELCRLASLRACRCIVGYSNHHPGIVAPQTAAALGASVIEIHLTLSRAMKGTDHAASIEPHEVRTLVENIRAAERMTALTMFSPPVASRNKLGRSLVAVRDIPEGATIGEADVCLKSPGDGVRWHDRDRIIGRRAVRDIMADTTILESEVSP